MKDLAQAQVNRVTSSSDVARFPTLKNKFYREVFFASNGFGPYKCFFCQEDVSFVEVVVHHIDEDRANNTPNNLGAAHDTCHRSYHTTKMRTGNTCRPGCTCLRHDEESKRRRVETIKASGGGGAGNAQLVAAGTRIFKERATCDTCGLESNHAGIWRHNCPG